MKIPFSVYDFFGYLAAGFVCLVAVDYAFSGGWLLEADPKLIPGIVLVFIAYAFGHAVSHVAWALLEEQFVRKVLRSPEETMFEKSASSRWIRFFPDSTSRCLQKLNEQYSMRQRMPDSQKQVAVFSIIVIPL